MTERIEPPANAVEIAIDVSQLSPCRSKRGAVIFKGGSILASGYNFKPRAFACDGSERCKATCRVEAVHAEQAALLLAALNAQGCDMLHVKTVDGKLAPSGGPSCVECSKLALVAGISGVWLYHEDGWRRYGMDEFHELSLAARCPERDVKAALLLARQALLNAGSDDVGAAMAMDAEAVAAIDVVLQATPLRATCGPQVDRTGWLFVATALEGLADRCAAGAYQDRLRCATAAIREGSLIIAFDPPFAFADSPPLTRAERVKMDVEAASARMAHSLGRAVPCANPMCSFLVERALYCCGGCRMAHEGGYEVHEDGSPLGHAERCARRKAKR